MLEQPELGNFVKLESFCEANIAYHNANYDFPHPSFMEVKFYNECGVFTIEDAIKWELYGMISDVSKEANGFRARFNWQDMSIDALEKELDYYAKEASETYEREQKWEQEATIEWKAHLRHLVSIGAKDSPTALKWDMLAEDAEEPGSYCYSKGLSYSTEPLIVKLIGLAA